MLDILNDLYQANPGVFVLAAILGYAFVGATCRAALLYGHLNRYWYEDFRAHRKDELKKSTFCYGYCARCNTAGETSIFGGIIWPITLSIHLVWFVLRIATWIGSGAAFRRKPKLPKAQVVRTADDK